MRQPPASEAAPPEAPTDSGDDSGSPPSIDVAELEHEEAEEPA